MRQWQSSQLSGPWAALRDRMPDAWERIRLGRLFRFLSQSGIAPNEVTVDTLADFKRWLREETLTRNPDRTLRGIWRFWNKACGEVAGWPDVTAPSLERTDLYALPPSSFSDSFRAELEAWRRAAVGDDLLSDRGPLRPLRPRTVSHKTSLLIRFASALVCKRVPITDIDAIADLVTVDRFKLGLRFFLDRNGGKPSPGINQITDVLLSVARHWVELDRSKLDELKRIARRIDHRQPGLTPTNRRRLTQFDDELNIARLQGLPDRLLELARHRPEPQRAALMVQHALAVSILLGAPFCLRNLAELNLERHVVCNGSRHAPSVRLVVEREETKNREVLDYPLPRQTVAIPDLYLKVHRPALLGGPDNGWLFPGRNGRAKSPDLLSKQIQACIRRHTGLVMHTHLFRHFAGKMSLRFDPANYEQVRRLLGHRSVNTSTMYYTGFATDAAGRRYHEMVLQPRSRSRLRER